MLELTPDQLDVCRALAQGFYPNHTVMAGIMLVRNDGRIEVAVRLERQLEYLLFDRGLLAASSSDYGLTWDIIQAKDERGGPVQTLYVAVPTSESVHLVSDPMDVDSDVSMVDV
jgi:hypothetical protein